MKYVWISNFFTRQAIAKIHFVLQSNNTGDTPFRVWLELEIFLTRWERTIFKISYSRNSKIFVWNPYDLVTFFTRQAIAKIHSVLQSTYAGYTPCRIWLDFDISLTRSKRPVFKIRYSRKSQIYVWNFNFFPRQL